jgi:hypothetical protein
MSDSLAHLTSEDKIALFFRAVEIAQDGAHAHVNEEEREIGSWFRAQKQNYKDSNGDGGGGAEHHR